MKKELLTIAFILSFLWSYSQDDSIHGVIIKIEGEKVFVDLSSEHVNIGTILNVLVDSSYFIHPITKEKILREDIDKTLIEVKQVYSNYSVAELAGGNFDKLKIGLSVIGVKPNKVTNKNENIQLSIDNSPNAQQNIGQNINITNVYSNQESIDVKKTKPKKNRVNHFFIDLMVSADNVTRYGFGAGYNFFPQLTNKKNEFIKIGFNINSLLKLGSRDALVLYGYENSDLTRVKESYNIPHGAELITDYMNTINIVPSISLRISPFYKLREKSHNLFFGIGYSYYDIKESVSFVENNSVVYSENVWEEYGPDLIIEYQYKKLFLEIKWRSGMQYYEQKGTYERNGDMDYGLGEVVIGYIFQ